MDGIFMSITASQSIRDPWQGLYRSYLLRRDARFGCGGMSRCGYRLSCGGMSWCGYRLSCRGKSWYRCWLGCGSMSRCRCQLRRRSRGRCGYRFGCGGMSWCRYRLSRRCRSWYRCRLGCMGRNRCRCRLRNRSVRCDGRVCGRGGWHRSQRRRRLRRGYVRKRRGRGGWRNWSRRGIGGKDTAGHGDMYGQGEQCMSQEGCGRSVNPTASHWLSRDSFCGGPFMYILIPPYPN